MPVDPLLKLRQDVAAARGPMPVRGSLNATSLQEAAMGFLNGGSAARTALAQTLNTMVRLGSSTPIGLTSLATTTVAQSANGSTTIVAEQVPKPNLTTEANKQLVAEAIESPTTTTATQAQTIVAQSVPKNNKPTLGSVSFGDDIRNTETA